MQVHELTHLHLYMYIDLHVYMYAYMHRHMYAGIHVSSFVSMRVDVGRLLHRCDEVLTVVPFLC